MTCGLSNNLCLQAKSSSMLSGEFEADDDKFDFDGKGLFRIQSNSPPYSNSPPHHLSLPSPLPIPLLNPPLLMAHPYPQPLFLTLLHESPNPVAPLQNTPSIHYLCIIWKTSPMSLLCFKYTVVSSVNRVKMRCSSSL